MPPRRVLLLAAGCRNPFLTADMPIMSCAHIYVTVGLNQRGWCTYRARQKGSGMAWILAVGRGVSAARGWRGECLQGQVR